LRLGRKAGSKALLVVRAVLARCCVTLPKNWVGEIGHCFTAAVGPLGAPHLYDPSCGPLILPGPPGEFRPEPPTDPDVNLSIHPARATQRRLPPSIKTRSSSGSPLTPPRRGWPAPFAPRELPRFLAVGSEEARLRASLRPPLKLHVHFSRMQLSRRLNRAEMPTKELTRLS
jgi:hypothetical protein